ncbi:MAG TPA: SPOR domain-containing protein [Candidatus Methylomirabilis sp.]|nr:SPOR domain-containing protein [Candidatus Methylomirabilis sp.]
MADRNDARPEFNPKHRIVGAIVIVAFAVIVLPLILRGREPPPPPHGGSEGTARGMINETKVVVTPVAPEEAKAKPALAAAPKSEMKTTAVENAPKPEPKSSAPVEKMAADKKPSAAPAPEKAATTAAEEKITKGWMVQVGTFSNAENATHLRDKLASHGHAVHAETVTLHGKRVVRLRVGPFRDKTQAMQAIAQIHKLTGVQGVALAYP